MRAVAMSAMIVVGVFALVACESIDPTEQSFAITFRNDLSRQVTLVASGDGSCRHATDTWRLSPGATAADNVSDRRVLSRWKVERGSPGRVVGCLQLSFGAKLPFARITHGRRVGGET
jgi:hypothetical protein